MPKRTSESAQTPPPETVPTKTPLGKKRKYKVPVRVDVTYLGHVFVSATSVEDAADVVFAMKDRKLSDLGDTVYSEESKSYLEGVGIPV